MASNSREGERRKSIGKGWNIQDFKSNMLDLQKKASNVFDKIETSIKLPSATSVYHSGQPTVLVSKRMRVSMLASHFAVHDLQDFDRPIMLIDRSSTGPGSYAFEKYDEIKSLIKNYICKAEGYGILGIIVLPNYGPFLVVITECRQAIKLNGHEILCITDTQFLPFQEFEDSPTGEKPFEKVTNEFRKWITANTFYFSYTYDITTSCQRQPLESTDNEPIYKRADVRFFWNRMIQSYFIDRNLDDYILPVMRGFIENTMININDQSAELILLSRLSCLRAGTFFKMNGVNDNGNVANFVETEQIVVSKEGKLTSFVQTRGSVPIFWEQRVTRGKYRPQLSRGLEATFPAFKKHFELQSRLYNKVFIINLLSSDDDEKIIRNGFIEELKLYRNPDLKYTSFDFNEKLGRNGQRFNMIGPLLLDGIYPDLLEFGIYMRDIDGSIISTQKGVFRSNCIDCLDRTNVTQAAIAAKGLLVALRSLGIVSKDTEQPLSNNNTPQSELGALGIEQIHKDLWTAHGNSISLAFTGTGALKSALTKTGKLTFGGLLDDGMKTIIRAYNSLSFRDSEMQLFFDCFLNSMEQVPDSKNRRYSVPSGNESNDILESSPLTIFIGTWNVNGQLPGEDVGGWVNNVSPSPSMPDVYVIGFQEVVSLNAMNVYNADQSNMNRWNQQILESIGLFQKFVLLRTAQLVGIGMSLFVREDQVNDFRDVCAEVVKVGLNGMAGNKGAISMRFNYLGSSFSFTNAHFGAGQKSIEERNFHYHEIMENTKFRTAKGLRGILDHDVVFFFGDLNYRLNLDYSTVRAHISQNDFSYLTSYDQLQIEMSNGNVFRGFSEGPLTFLPTYKFDPGTDTYDTSEKRRTPAWCDRILFLANNLKQYNYKYTPLLTSDHKPVSAVFQAYVKK